MLAFPLELLKTYQIKILKINNEKDSCGVCNGSNLCASTDCLGKVNGTAKLVKIPCDYEKLILKDKCGVCNGTNKCVDCKGVAFGNMTLVCLYRYW